MKEEALISDISRFANSQNAVKQSDLSANKPFHVEIEKLSLTVYCPDGNGPLVLRARGRQLQHDARARGNDSRATQELKMPSPRRAR